MCKTIRRGHCLELLFWNPQIWRGWHQCLFWWFTVCLRDFKRFQCVRYRYIDNFLFVFIVSRRKSVRVFIDGFECCMMINIMWYLTTWFKCYLPLATSWFLECSFQNMYFRTRNLLSNWAIDSDRINLLNIVFYVIARTGTSIRAEKGTNIL